MSGPPSTTAKRECGPIEGPLLWDYFSTEHQYEELIFSNSTHGLLMSIHGTKVVTGRQSSQTYLKTYFTHILSKKSTSWAQANDIYRRTSETQHFHTYTSSRRPTLPGLSPESCTLACAILSLPRPIVAMQWQLICPAFAHGPICNFPYLLPVLPCRKKTHHWNSTQSELL